MSRAADQFFAGDGSALSTAKWAATNAGPFTSSFTNGNVANFAIVNGTGTGGSITVAGIVATENFMLTAVSGTISNQGNGVVGIDVATGKTLDLSTQSMSGSATGGYIKNGQGVLALAGNSYGGGFTLNSGAVILRGVNALGSAATNSLTINGGIIAGSAARDLSGKFTAGITIGGDFQLGELTANIPSAANGANLTFDNNMGLGATTRTITVGNNGIMTFGGVISGGSGAGVTFSKNAAAAGVFFLTNSGNSYSGPTTIQNGVEVRIDTDATLGNGTGALNLAGGTLMQTQSRNTIVPNNVNVTGASVIRNTATSLTPQIVFSGTLTGDGTSLLTLRNDGATVEYNVRLSNTALNFANPIALDNATGLALTQLQSNNTTGTQTFSGVISGNGRYVRLQAGTTYLTGDNTYAGGTVINSGTVYASNSDSTKSATGSGPVDVAANATLGGKGYVAGLTTIAVGGTLAPGESVGTLTFAGKVEIDGTLSIQYDDTLAGSKIDVAVVGGELDISAASLTFADISSGGAGLSQPAYVFAKYGTLTGTFGPSTMTPAGYSIVYNYFDGVSSNNIALVGAVVPEAPALALGGVVCTAAAVGAIVARRRKPTA